MALSTGHNLYHADTANLTIVILVLQRVPLFDRVNNLRNTVVDIFSFTFFGIDNAEYLSYETWENSGFSRPRGQVNFFLHPTFYTRKQHARSNYFALFPNLFLYNVAFSNSATLFPLAERGTRKYLKSRELIFELWRYAMFCENHVRKFQNLNLIDNRL